MNRIIKYIYLGLIVLLFSATTSTAETLTYRDTLKLAIDNSFDLKMSALDIDISRAELKSAKADLYPTLYTQVNTEYNNGLGNTSNINYVGNTVVSSYTQYRNLASVGLSYNLFDFGVIGKKVFIAKKDVEQKKVMVDLQLKDLKLKILDLYTKTLQFNDEIKTKSEILKVYEEMFNAKERLFQAGTSGKISVMDEAVKIARTQDDIHNSKLELKNALNDLSSFTLQKYNSDNLEVLDLEELNIQPSIVLVNNFTSNSIKHFPLPNPPPQGGRELLDHPKSAGIEIDLDLSFDPEKSLESKYYDFELEKKKAELEMYKKQRLPAFKFYTNYLMYGQDPSQYAASFTSFKQASLAFGISGSYAFFDGFKNRASREKAALEIKKIQLEKDKKLTEIKTAYEKSYTSYQSYNEELASKKDLLSRVKEKLTALERMSKNGLIPQDDILTAKAELLNQEFELQKNIVNISSKIKEIEIMTGRDNEKTL